MRINRGACLVILCLLTVLFSGGVSCAQWGMKKDLKTEEPPLDVAVTLNGRWIYVLTEGGNLLVYGPDGTLRDKIEVGENMDRVRVGPLEDVVLLSSRKDSLVRILQVDLVQKFEVSGSPSLGLVDAPVEIIVFSDYQCGYCSRLVSVIKEVRNTFSKEVKVVFKNYPIKSHPYAMKAALAALAAGNQDRFWEFHDRLFQNFDGLNDARIEQIARELRLNMPLFEKMRKDSKIIAQVRKDLRAGQKAGVRSVPAVFINGKRLRDRTIEGFYHRIDLILQEKGK